RPLAYCKESDIERFSEAKGFPIIPCNLCGSQENLQRQNIKNMLAQWEREQPGRSENIFAAVCNVAPSQLGDRELFDFVTLQDKQDKDRKSIRLNSSHVKISYAVFCL